MVVTVPASRYLGPQRLTYAMAPIRVAYLVRDGNDADARAAVVEACSRWGGLSEPIVPVTEDGDLAGDWDQILDDLAPEAVVGVGVDDRIGRACADRLGYPYVPHRLIDTGGTVSASTHPVVFHRAASSHGFNLVGPVDTAPLWHVAAVGDIDEIHTPAWAGARVGFTRTGTDDAMARAQLAGSSVVGQTMHGLASPGCSARTWWRSSRAVTPGMGHGWGAGSRIGCWRMGGWCGR